MKASADRIRQITIESTGHARRIPPATSTRAPNASYSIPPTRSAPPLFGGVELLEEQVSISEGSAAHKQAWHSDDSSDIKLQQPGRRCTRNLQSCRPTHALAQSLDRFHSCRKCRTRPPQHVWRRR
ncbi:hypothetical protein CALVIDRAFT_197011 [Calocera viscosa TUFC12733]|uniref:Uncharacterized protein n=1 Tax=Calocera viscosa (strain TUFC12733) TaxID=1330018 RepID=A0A167KHS0_CALVF|nr:hypothetical protein CALVIDRAFT_197011 [Calocera viscosa TUFC12733]